MIALRKLWRELRTQLGQTIAVLSVVALGVMLFVTSAGAYQDLRQSYADTQTQLAQADLQLDVSHVSEEDVEHARALPGVAAADARTIVELPVRIHHNRGAQRVALRIISLPRADRPALDRVFVIEGRAPERGRDEVLLEKHLAQHHHIDIGATIVVDEAGVSRTLRVCGVGVSAEYLWVARSAQDIFPSPDEFGVGWMRRSDLRTLASSIHEPRGAADALAVAASDDANQLLVQRKPDTSETTLMASLAGLLGERMILATPKEQLVAVRLLQMDVDGYRGMAAFFPVFFLGVGAFIVAAVLARLVDAQRAVLGTLMALGVGRAKILAQVLGHALTLGGVGSTIGACAGLAASPNLTRAYASDLGIPFVTSRSHVQLALIGIAIGLAVSALAGLAPALHASSLAPAEAMRPPKPRTGMLARLARHLPAPLPVRMALRDILGRPLRSASTALGISGALVLVLATGSMLDSVRTTLAVLFRDARRYDVRVELVTPEPTPALRSRFSSVAEVSDVETLVDVPAIVEANGRSSPTLLQGLPDHARLARSVDVDGRLVAPGAGEIILTRTLASRLGVAPGDRVGVRIGGGEASFLFAGVADGVMGPTASARLDDVQRAYSLGDRVNAVALTTRDVGALHAALTSMGDVGHVEDVRSLRAQIDTLMGLGWVLLGAMLVFGAVLAAAILFNTATLGILERARELATLRALGRTHREISAAITLENALLAAFGIGIGYPLATLTSRKVLALYSNDLFRLPYVMRPETVTFTIAGIIAVLFLAQWPALRHLARASLAEAVRTRE